MDEPRLVFLFAHQEQIVNLLQRGISVDELERVELNKLVKCFAIGNKIDAVLTFISMQQLLGLNNSPLLLDPDSLVKPQPNKAPMGYNSIGDFYIFKYDNKLEIKYDNTRISAQRQITFGVLVEHLREHYQAKTQDKEPQELVHNWYTVTQLVDSKQRKLAIYYCPESHLVVQDLCDELFPKDYFVSISLEHVNYYK